jgi:hypothetical protein
MPRLARGDGQVEEHFVPRGFRVPELLIDLTVRRSLPPLQGIPRSRPSSGTLRTAEKRAFGRSEKGGSLSFRACGLETSFHVIKAAKPIASSPPKTGITPASAFAGANLRFAKHLDHKRDRTEGTDRHQGAAGTPPRVNIEPLGD